MPVCQHVAAELAARLFDSTPEVVHLRTSINSVFMLRFPNGSEKILKANDDPNFETGLRREQRVLPQLSSLGIAVSSLELTQQDLHGAPFSFSVMPRAATHSLAELRWKTPNAVANLFRDAGAWLARLHGVEPGLVADALEPDEARHLEIDERQRIRADVAEARLGLSSIDVLFARFAELQHKPKPCLIHSDFNASQVMVQGGAISYVVDWDFAQHGRPMRDLGLCLAYTKFFDRAPEFARALFRAYERVHVLSRQDVTECTLWEIYTLLRVTSAQHLAGSLENSALGMELIRSAKERLQAATGQ